MLKNLMQGIFSMRGEISPDDMAEQVAKIYGAELKRNGGRPFAVAVMFDGRGPAPPRLQIWCVLLPTSIRRRGQNRDRTD